MLWEDKKSNEKFCDEKKIVDFFLSIKFCDKKQICMRKNCHEEIFLMKNIMWLQKLVITKNVIQKNCDEIFLITQKTQIVTTENFKLWQN